MANTVMTITNRSAEPVVLNTVAPTPLGFTIPGLDYIVVGLPDDYLNELISQCVRRGLAYDLRSE
jgi:hypothetical protein